MACADETHLLPWITLAAIGTGVIFIPAGEWFDANLLTTGKSFGEVRGRNGLIQAIPAIQLTNDPHAPSNNQTTNMNTAFTADGSYDPDGAHAISSGAFKYARIGWNVSLTSGATLATMTAMAVIQLGRGT